MKHSGEVAAAAEGMRGDRKADAGASAGGSGRSGGVNECMERLNCGILGMMMSQVCVSDEASYFLNQNECEDVNRRFRAGSGGFRAGLREYGLP